MLLSQEEFINGINCLRNPSKIVGPIPSDGSRVCLPYSSDLSRRCGTVVCGLTMAADRIQFGFNCGIRHVTVPIATRILIANVRHIGVSNICVINLVYFKMQV